MKKYSVYASQLVIYKKEVEANSEEEAQEKAWEDDSLDWNWWDYGDWQLEKTTLNP
jgi:hypothetical protein